MPGSRRRAGSAVLLRCPMIPEYNARKEHLDGIAAPAPVSKAPGT